MEETEQCAETGDGLSVCERAEAFGIDLSMVEENLRLTVDERLTKHSNAAALILDLRAGLTDGQ